MKPISIIFVIAFVGIAGVLGFPHIDRNQEFEVIPVGYKNLRLKCRPGPMSSSSVSWACGII